MHNLLNLLIIISIIKLIHPTLTILVPLSGKEEPPAPVLNALSSSVLTAPTQSPYRYPYPTNVLHTRTLLSYPLHAPGLGKAHDRGVG